jgi:hypothetical protein
VVDDPASDGARYRKSRQFADRMRAEEDRLLVDEAPHSAICVSQMCLDWTRLATVDRLLHHAHLILTTGGSRRLAEALAGKGVIP